MNTTVSPSVPRPRSRALLVVLALFAGHLSWLLTRWGPAGWQPWLGNLWVVVVCVAAIGLIVRALPGRPQPERRGWRWVVAGLLAYVWGAAGWAGLELLTRTPPFPSVADLGYLLVAPCLAVAIFSFPRPALSRVAAWTLGLDLLVFLVAVGSWFWALLVVPALAADGSLLARGLAGLYPLLDLLLLTLLMEMALRGPSPPYLRWLGAAVASYACGDLIFALLTSQNRYQTGDLVDLCWPLAAVLCAVAVQTPVPVRSVPVGSVPVGAGAAEPPAASWLSRAGPALSFVLPYGAALTSAGFLVWCLENAPALAPLALVSMLLVTLLVAARQTLAWHEAQGLRLDLQRINASLEEQVRERTLEIRATFEGGLLSLGTALEARDFETAGHTERVVKWAHALGQALQLSAAELDSLVEGAYLHDLGKLAVPDQILLKPGKLTPEEWTVMQSHAARGHALAARLPHLSAGALDVIRHHHERWDGGGYPFGLSGQTIPRLARLFAVCDVYDALTSVRPYKAAWSAEAARAELQAQAGRHFDPESVQAFLTLDLDCVLTQGSPQPAAQEAQSRFEHRLQDHTRGLNEALGDAETLLTLARLSALPHSVERITRDVLSTLASAVAFDWGALMRADQDGIRSEVMWQVYALRPSPALPETIALPRGEGLIWSAIESGASLFIQNYADQPAANPQFVRQVQSVAFLPLVAAESEAVLMVVRAGSAEPWTPREQALLEAASRTLSTACQRASHLAALQRLARTDALTGLLSRRALEDDLQDRLRSAAASPDAGLDADPAPEAQGPVGLLLLDLGGFKTVNAAQGHPAGDEALRTVARILSQTFGPPVYRLGGDEFALLITPCSPEALAQAAQQARCAVKLALCPAFLGLSVHVGVASSVPCNGDQGSAGPGGPSTVEGLLHAADLQLSGEKAASRHAARPGLPHAEVAGLPGAESGAPYR
ncbi:HD domain-containing phosphohydrolase [Deinococcus koreensis]|uniref:Diguanylate cyclase n=1 Tax=Deinococcus koreensis TaxID=2054903 RepID=A0A2K3UXH0_9DEIO|nr:HD domain-containing phosphohydrolase [Deinococcus koreensis]PNY81226.1 hypothetical protein CVO96_07380 [Deinococcus koreensis]